MMKAASCDTSCAAASSGATPAATTIETSAWLCPAFHRSRICTGGAEIVQCGGGVAVLRRAVRGRCGGGAGAVRLMVR